MAYRNRYDEYLRKRQGVLPDAKQWKAADYARISREDGDKEESDSIGTQFDIIDDYIAQMCIRDSTIRNWQCKHITKINRITVYPFIYKRVNRYIIVLLIFNSFVANLNYLLYRCV